MKNPFVSPPPCAISGCGALNKLQGVAMTAFCARCGGRAAGAAATLVRWRAGAVGGRGRGGLGLLRARGRAERDGGAERGEQRVRAALAEGDGGERR